MKRIILSIFIFTLMLGCEDQEFAPLGEPRDFIANISSGTFVISSIVQDDGNSELDISEFIVRNSTFSDFSLSLSEDGSYNLTRGPVPFPANNGTGIWEFDSVGVPENIIFDSDPANVVTLTAPVLNTLSDLSVEWTPNCNGVLYRATLTRINQ